MKQLLIVMICATIISIIVFLFLLYKQKRKNRRNKKLVEVFNKLYLYASRIPFTGRKVFNIRTKIYNNKKSEEWLIRYKTIQYLLISWIVAIIASIFVVIYFKNNLYVTLTLLFFSYNIKEMVLDALIGDDTNLLVGLSNYLEELQQNFIINNRDVHATLKETNETTGNHTVARHCEDIENVIDDMDECEQYVTECPNDHLKLLAINCQLTNEYGDKKDLDGKSTFTENLFYIRQNIEAEIFKRRRLQYWLRHMPLLCVLPILGFTPYEIWAHNLLKTSDIFYKTSLGFILKLAITFISILCFYIIKSYTDVSRRQVKIKGSYWEQKILNYKPAARFIKLISPKDKSRRRYRYIKLISNSGYATKIEYIFVRKVLCGIVGFILSISIIISVHRLNYSNIIADRSPSFQEQTVAIGTEQVSSTKIENDLLDKVEVSDVDGSVSRLERELRKIGVSDDITVNQLAQKIVRKKIALQNNQYVHSYELLISLLVGVLAWFAPNINMKVKVSLRRYEMENEVVLFETIILILMYHENATDELILETMLKFANIFKEPIEKALKEVRKGGINDLDEILSGMTYRNFTTIIRNILKVESIKSKDAFMSLADNRKSYLENKKEENRRLISRRVNKAALISLIPIQLIVIIYIGVGMMYVAFNQTNSLQDDNNMMKIEQKSNN